ncbi:hypothetical protein F7725_014771 [Dissostichus mawsoni]|uniref:Uncharacterized protein n=1 Tax=Dissostichus mawsoni TaxID=36200 RepID=A0A7J5YXZ1_DISMA|nr:hypothetical protein F7725_014771 [Dissostichus mawsoni]
MKKSRQPVAERRQVDSAGKVSLKTAGWCRVTPSYCLQDHEAQTKSNSAATPHERNMAAVRPYGIFPGSAHSPDAHWHRAAPRCSSKREREQLVLLREGGDKKSGTCDCGYKCLSRCQRALAPGSLNSQPCPHKAKIQGVDPKADLVLPAGEGVVAPVQQRRQTFFHNVPGRTALGVGKSWRSLQGTVAQRLSPGETSAEGKE